MTGVDTGPVRATSTASVVLSAAVSDSLSSIYGHGLTPPFQSKLVVLRSLAKFLRHAISPQATSAEEYSSTSAKSTTPTWYLSSSFLSEDAFRSFNSLLQPSSSSQKSQNSSTPETKVWQSECDPETGNEDFVQCFEAADAGAGVESFWTLQELSEAVTLEDGRRESEADFDIVRMNLSSKEMTLTSPCPPEISTNPTPHTNVYFPGLFACCVFTERLTAGHRAVHGTGCDGYLSHNAWLVAAEYRCTYCPS